jgi:hypothetical protein
VSQFCIAFVENVSICHSLNCLQSQCCGREHTLLGVLEILPVLLQTELVDLEERGHAVLRRYDQDAPHPLAVLQQDLQYASKARLLDVDVATKGDDKQPTLKHTRTQIEVHEAVELLQELRQHMHTNQQLLRGIRRFFRLEDPMHDQHG